MPAFVELLSRSCFSFLEGASQPEELVDGASALGLTALGLVDRGGLYGIARAHDRIRRASREVCPPRLIVGAELDVRSPRTSLAFLVQSSTGYSNLCRLLTLAHASSPKGEAWITLDDLREAADLEGLFVLLLPPCLASVARQIREQVGDRCAIAVHRHYYSDDRLRDEDARHISGATGISIVASARPLYHEPQRRRLADVLHSIRLGMTLDKAGVLLAPSAHAVLRDAEYMGKLFSDEPTWVERSAQIADSCQFSMSELKYAFPSALTHPGETPDRALRRHVEEKLPDRFSRGLPIRVRTQIEKELALIEQIKVAPYFLSVLEVVEMARKRRILCQGRGSAANSAVCYAVGITSVNPDQIELLFERFLSAERGEPPDIDIDFEHERREEVIQAIYSHYGRDRAAMVSEVIAYRGKSALREVGKAFGLSLDQVDALARSLMARGLRDATPEDIRKVGLDPDSRRVRLVLEMAREIQGFPRHLSIHSGGFVLSSTPLHHIAPVEPATMENRTVIPWDKDDLDTLGFFKIDVLALGMLTATRKAIELTTKSAAAAGLTTPFDDHVRPDGSVDPIGAFAAIPTEAPAVYEAFGRADTIGVFQIESRAQMSMLPTLKPMYFYDIVVEVAIVRPGPIQGGMVHPYLARRLDKKLVKYPHKDLEHILERTLGVPLFQEQVMQIAMTGAGYTGGQADELRRDMASWKKHGRLMAHKEKLLEGFRAKGIADEFANAMFEQIKGFGEYGFPESHAASFALIVYATGWLKVHQPAAFAAALLNSQPMGFYSASSIVQDVQRHGIEVRVADVSDSDWDCTLEWNQATSTPAQGTPQPAIRLGLRQIHGLSESVGLSIEEARGRAPFHDIEDLAGRAYLRQAELERLAEAGALASLVPDRRKALWHARRPRDFGLLERIDDREPEPDLRPLSAPEQLVLDYAYVGLSVNDHPMRHMRPHLPGTLRSDQLANVPDKTVVRIAGLVINRQRPATASGVVFATLEDEAGTSNLVFWSTVFDQYRTVIVSSPMIEVIGVLERRGSVIHILSRSVRKLGKPGKGVKVSSRDFR